MVPVFVCIYRGQTPADAEFSYLETAKRLEMYGVDLHSARVRVRISLLSLLRYTQILTIYQSMYTPTHNHTHLTRSCFELRPYILEEKCKKHGVAQSRFYCTYSQTKDTDTQLRVLNVCVCTRVHTDMHTFNHTWAHNTDGKANCSVWCNKYPYDIKCMHQHTQININNTVTHTNMKAHFVYK